MDAPIAACTSRNDAVVWRVVGSRKVRSHARYRWCNRASDAAAVIGYVTGEEPTATASLVERLRFRLRALAVAQKVRRGLGEEQHKRAGREHSAEPESATANRTGGRASHAADREWSAVRGRRERIPSFQLHSTLRTGGWLSWRSCRTRSPRPSRPSSASPAPPRCVSLKGLGGLRTPRRGGRHGASAGCRTRQPEPHARRERERRNLEGARSPPLTGARARPRHAGDGRHR